MNARLAAALVIAGLIAPVTGHAADTRPAKENIRENADDPAPATRIRAEYARGKPLRITRDTAGVSPVKNEIKGHTR